MNKSIKLIAGIAVCIFMSSQVWAQFKISGEFRPRTEMSHGYKTLANPDQDASLLTTQRTRLNLHYKGEKIVTKLVLQDVRAWGSQPQLVGNEDFATSVHEAWAEAFFTENFSFKAGRQEVIYDDHRIFGSVGWAQQARSHDMGIFKYESDFKLHVGLAYHQNTNRTNNIYNGPDAYKALQFLWFNKKMDDLGLSFLFLNNGTPFADSVNAGVVVEESIKYSQTLGPRVTYKAGDLSIAGNFYYQMGKDAADRDLSAFEAAIDFTYKMNDNLSAFAGYEILSGTAYDEDVTKNKSFTPFYGTNHKFNGFMDYFYVGNHVNNVGLSDIHFGAKYSKDKIFVQCKVLLFSAAADIAADTDKFLGTEIDLWAGYKLSKEINIGVGYSHMIGTDAMVTLKGSGDKDEISNWAYVQIAFKPTFLNIEK